TAGPAAGVNTFWRGLSDWWSGPGSLGHRWIAVLAASGNNASRADGSPGFSDGIVHGCDQLSGPGRCALVTCSERPAHARAWFRCDRFDMWCSSGRAIELDRRAFDRAGRLDRLGANFLGDRLLGTWLQ